MEAKIIKELEAKIGYSFNEKELLKMAFTHTSYANEHSLGSYERLEFLGDSLVNFFVAEYLYNRYPDVDEGFLSKARAKIVSKNTLSSVIKGLWLNEYVKVSLNSISDEVRNSVGVAADLFEAITGAVYLDGGIENAREFVLKLLADYLNDKYDEENITDFKSKILEYAAKAEKSIRFSCIDKKSPSGNYVVTVIIDKEKIATASSPSKKRAEQQAAKECLEKLGK